MGVIRLYKCDGRCKKTADSCVTKVVEIPQAVEEVPK